jgi:hypothetical protein
MCLMVAGPFCTDWVSKPGEFPFLTRNVAL